MGCIPPVSVKIRTLLFYKCILQIYILQMLNALRAFKALLYSEAVLLNYYYSRNVSSIVLGLSS